MDCLAWMMGDPVARDAHPVAQPDAIVLLNVIEQPRQCADPPGAANDAAVQADAHHPRPALAS